MADNKCIVRVRRLVARIPDNGPVDGRLRVVRLSLNSTVLNFNRRRETGFGYFLYFIIFLFEDWTTE